jgi:hypothetical protein
VPASASAQVICLPNLPILQCPTPPQPTQPPAEPTQPTPPSQPTPTPQPPAAPKGTNDFICLVSDDAFANPGAYRTSAFTNQAAVGVRLIRVTFDWAQIEKAPGSYDFSVYDAYVGDAARAGLNVLPILFNPPAFRAGGSGGKGTYPPKNYADLGVFGAALVGRYGPNGSYWAEHGNVPKLPIRAWQIWNEPNLKAYWPKGPNAKEYVKLLKAARGPIKKADRGAEIVTAGMPESRIGVSLKKFIPAMYKAHAKGSFDTLAINPYGKNANAVLKNLQTVRKLMNDNRDKRSKIWATEIGWSDAGPSSPQKVGSSGQAKNLSSVVDKLTKNRRKLKLRGLVYFSWRDAPPYAGGVDFWGLHTGLLNQDGSPKPALYALQGAVAKTAGK